MTLLDAAAPLAGYFDSPWPCEDGGPRRQAVGRGVRFASPTNGPLAMTARAAWMANMMVLRAPGEVFLQGSTGPGPDTTGWIERIHSESLEVLARSPDLPAGGAWWPGSIAAHADGYLYAVQGRFVHKLDPQLRIVAARELPRPDPYNGFIVMPDGRLVTKNFVQDGSVASYFMAIDPARLEPTGAEVAVPEGSIARLSADGDFVYVIGDHTAFRYAYAGGTLVRDEGWSRRYRTRPDAEQSYGWDPVIALDSVWFQDNGQGVFGRSFRGGGVSTGPLHLHRIAVGDAGDHDAFAPFGIGHGTIANPPVIDVARRIAVTYDSGNERIAGLRIDGPGRFTRLWEHTFGASNHFVLFPESGEVVVNDFDDDTGEQVVVLDVESGTERGRVAIGSPVQSVVFQAPGWAGDVYTCTFSTVARVYRRGY